MQRIIADSFFVRYKGSTSTQMFLSKGATLTARRTGLSDDDKQSLCMWQLDP